MLKIGIDFDNTIACYDKAFYEAALEKGWIPSELSPIKGAIRDYLRKENKEDLWTELQGYIYGARMDLASPFPGLEAFLEFCLQKQYQVFIISHKTLYPYRGPKYNLHEAAFSWLRSQAFFPYIHQLFFELTLEEKLQRIRRQKCDFFIDDLPELLLEREFPIDSQRILFDSGCCLLDHAEYIRLSSWREIRDFFGQRF